MKIYELVTKLLETEATAEGTPITAKREAETVVTVADGGTVVIGGLTRDDTTKVEQKIPLLGDIPFLGRLFRRTREVGLKSNLLIFVSPHIVTDREDIEKLTEAKKKEQKDFLEQE